MNYQYTGIGMVMVGWMDRLMDGWVNISMDGWMDGWRRGAFTTH
jgi:hypothetical protein